MYSLYAYSNAVFEYSNMHSMYAYSSGTNVNRKFPSTTVNYGMFVLSVITFALLVEHINEHMSTHN